MIKVIVIEDEAMVRKGIIETLDWKAMQCTVIAEASNGRQGVDLIHELQPDLVITDVRMPYMDGVSMIKQLRAAGCNSHFILLSAHSDFSYAQSAIRAGASDYLVKPLRDEELKQTILRVFFPENEGKEERTQVPVQLQFQPNTEIENKYVKQAIHYIKSNFGEDITISTVADYLQISEGYLSRVFKKETNYTFTNYLSYYRISIACSLLQNCRMKVYEVTNKVGYTDTAYFSTLFKKLMGTSPSEYQREWQKKIGTAGE